MEIDIEAMNANKQQTINLQVVQHLSAGGIETMALDLLRYADKNEHMLLISLEGRKEDALTHWPVLRPFSDKLIFLDKQPGWQPKLIWRLRNWMKKRTINSVHTHHIGPLIYAGIASKFAGVKKRIHTEHDVWHLSNRKRRLLQSILIKLTSPIMVADADIVAKTIKTYWPNLQTQTIHNGIDTERFKPGDSHNARSKLALPTNVTLVGCSGRLEPVKGQKTLIDALARLPANIHLAVAGSGSCASELQNQAKELGLDKRVHFLGRIDDMPSFYQAIDLFCLPSQKEGMPLAPLEAQACGARAVVTNVGGSAEALCPETGYLVPANDSEKMAEQLNAALAEKNKQSPRDFVIANGDVRMMAKSYASLRR